MAKLILFIVLLLAPAVAFAQQSGDYAAWLQTLEQDAIGQGISPATVHAALDGVVPDDEVIDLDHEQPETTVTFDHYAHRVLSADRVREARKLLDENSDDLDAIADHYGVQPQIIVALWGIESSFGHDSGHYSIINSLLTLAYEGRRADMFRSELFDALRIIDKEGMPPDSLVGSWAGAMGQCQFMPSTYLHYAVDYDQDGHRDIWANPHDVWASIANYLSAEGWSADLTWGREVELEKDIDAAEIGLDRQHSLAEWSSMGVRSVGGAKLPDRDLQASLIQPDGPDGRSFLVYDNFRALMRWNRSTYFATSVGLLADKIK